MRRRNSALDCTFSSCLRQLYGSWTCLASSHSHISHFLAINIYIPSSALGGTLNHPMTSHCPFLSPPQKVTANILRHIVFFLLILYIFFFLGLRFLVVAQTYFINIHILNYESQTIGIVNQGTKLNGDPDGHAMRCQSKMGSETFLKM